MPAAAGEPTACGLPRAAQKFSKTTRYQVQMSNPEEPQGNGWEIVEHEPDPTETGRRAGVRRRAAEAAANQRADHAADHAVEGEAAAAPREWISAFAVSLLGLFGGIYLLYSWGWFMVATAYAQLNALTAAPSGVIGVMLQTVLHWLAPAAPGAWFILVLLLCKKTETLKMVLGLLLGTLILMPLPLFLTTIS